MGRVIKKGLRSFDRNPLIYRSGAPERIRTSDLRIRSPALYPAELQARVEKKCLCVFGRTVKHKFKKNLKKFICSVFLKMEFKISESGQRIKVNMKMKFKFLKSLLVPNPNSAEMKKGSRSFDRNPLYLLSGAPERIRTSDLRIRSPALYPAELQARVEKGSMEKRS